VQNLIERHVAPGDTLLLFTAADVKLEARVLARLQADRSTVHAHVHDEMMERMREVLALMVVLQLFSIFIAGGKVTSDDADTLKGTEGYSAFVFALVVWVLYMFAPLKYCPCLHNFDQLGDTESEDTEGIRYDEVQEKKHYEIERYKCPAAREDRSVEECMQDGFRTGSLVASFNGHPGFLAQQPYVPQAQPVETPYAPTNYPPTNPVPAAQPAPQDERPSFYPAPIDSSQQPATQMVSPYPSAGGGSAYPSAQPAATPYPSASPYPSAQPAVAAYPSAQASAYPQSSCYQPARNTPPPQPSYPAYSGAAAPGADQFL